MSNFINGELGLYLPNTLDNENVFDSSLSGYLPLDGSQSMIGNLNMGNNNINNLANATSNDEAINLGQLNVSLLNYVDKSSIETVGGIKRMYDTTTGDGILALGRTALTDYIALRYTDNLGATKWSIGNEALNNNNLNISKDGTTNYITLDYTNQQIDVNNLKIINLATPTANFDASTKKYVDDSINALSGSYITTNTTQDISGSKNFYNTSGSGNSFLQLTKVNNGSYAFIRFNNPSVTSSYDIGRDDNDNIYFFQSGLGYAMSIQNNGNITMGAGTSLLPYKLFVDGSCYVDGIAYMAGADLLTATIDNLGTCSLNHQATNKGYVDNNFVSLNTNQTIYGVKTFDNTLYTNTIDNGNDRIINVSLPINSNDVANKNYTDTQDTATYNNAVSYVNTQLNSYVTLATNQTISGIKSYSSIVNFLSNIDIERSDPKNESLIYYYLNANVEWVAGVRGTPLNANSNYIIARGTLFTPMITVSSSLSEINMHSNRLLNVATPTLSTDAVNKSYTDNNFVNLTTNQTIAGIKSFGPDPNNFGDGVVKMVRSNASRFCYFSMGTTGVGDEIHFGLGASGPYFFHVPTGVRMANFGNSGTLSVGRGAFYATAGYVLDIGGNILSNGRLDCVNFGRQFDIRTIKPNDISASSSRFGFGCWNNNNATPFADLIHLNGWSDSSGGNTNLLMVRKDTFGLRQYQGAYASASNYSSYVDYVFANSSGNVALGTTATPTVRLDVSGEIRAFNSSGNRRMIIQSPNANFSYLSFLKDGGQVVDIGCYENSHNFYIYTLSAGEAMHIKYTNGYMGLGLNNPAYQLELSLNSAGKPTTNTWTISSDERIKEDIVLADTQICYDNVKNLHLKYFKWSENYLPETKDRHSVGWIAQDVEQFFPNAVDTIEERFGFQNFKTLDSDQLFKANWGATSKLIEKVEALEKENLELKERLKLIEQKLFNLC